MTCRVISCKSRGFCFFSSSVVRKWLQGYILLVKFKKSSLTHVCFLLQEVPPAVITEIETATRTVTQVHIETQFVPNETVAIPPPANTRRVAKPTPSPYTTSFSTMLPRTTSVEVLIEHEEAVVREEPVEVEDVFEVEEPRRRVVRKSPPPPAYPPAAYRQAPQRWW